MRLPEGAVAQTAEAIHLVHVAHLSALPAGLPAQAGGLDIPRDPAGADGTALLWKDDFSKPPRPRLVQPARRPERPGDKDPGKHGHSPPRHPRAQTLDSSR